MPVDLQEVAQSITGTKLCALKEKLSGAVARLMKADDAPSGYEQQLSQFDDFETTPQQSEKDDDATHAKRYDEAMHKGNTTMTTIEEVSGEGSDSVPCYDLNISSAD